MKLTQQLNKDLLESKELEPYFKESANPYAGTLFEHYYNLTPKTKGTVGEKFAKALCGPLNRKVEKRSSAGNDATIDGIKTEVKVSLANGGIPGSFSFNHLAVNKDYDRILLIGLTSEYTHAVWFTKADLKTFIQDGKYFALQQGGKKGGNDDYMFMTGKTWNAFLNEPCVKNFETEW